MKVFISHHSSDSAIAAKISARLLSQHRVLSYLDVVDPHIGRNGEDLADHIRSQMGSCDHLIAVVSFNTRASQWVPWEIGVATEKEFPLATYSEMISDMPEFLVAWPRLRSMTDLDTYVAASQAGQRTYTAKRSMFTETAAHRAGTRAFYTEIRRRLGQ